MVNQQTAVLKQLVALKRKRGEQEVLGLQQALSHSHKALADLSANLDRLNDPTLDFHLSKLVNQHGLAMKIISDIAIENTNVSQVELDLRLARQALKQVFFSEEQLRRSLET